MSKWRAGDMYFPDRNEMNKMRGGDPNSGNALVQKSMYSDTGMFSAVVRIVLSTCLVVIVFCEEVLGLDENHLGIL